MQNPRKQNIIYKKASERMFAGADKVLFQRAAELRKQLTPAEEITWSYLRTKPFSFKFRRQHVYLNYILDFYCHELKLVIEIDGSVHEQEEVKKNDQTRQSHIEKQGLHVLRFTNDQVESAFEEIIKKIDSYLTLKLKPNEKRTQ